MPAYRVIDVRGATVRTVPARADQVFTVELVRAGPDWRILALDGPIRPGQPAAPR